MGNSASRTAQQGVRKFPTRTPGASPASNPPAGPATAAGRAAAAAGAAARKTSADVSYSKDNAVRADSMDPDMMANSAFSDRLKTMGVAQPSPTFSPSSTAAFGSSSSQPLGPSRHPPASKNTTLSVLEARRKLQEEASAEFDNMGQSTDKGREFLDVGTIRDILILRSRGVNPATIEAKFRLKRGVVDRLGSPRVFSPLIPGSDAETP